MRNKLLSLLTAASLFICGECVSASYTSEYKAKTEVINNAVTEYNTNGIALGECLGDDIKGSRNTIFIFMIGSDMAEYAEYDICEMLESGYGDRDTNVILIAGGSEDWSIDALKKNPVGIYKLTENGFMQLEDEARYNLFDTDDIYKLMFRYMARYRADSYSVLFWDHGGGFVSGFGKDSTGENKSITSAELAGVFADIKRDVKEDYGLDYSYDIAGFDACFMGDIQTAQSFADAGFRYFIGSEDTESRYGWCYDFLGGELSEGGEALCAKILDSTEQFNKEHSVGSYTLSCVDLGRTEKVISALEEVSGQLNSQSTESYLAARYKTKVFGNSLSGSRFGGSSHDYADISDYAEKIGAAGADTSKLTEAVSEAVLDNRSSEKACGLSVYSYYSSSKSSFNSWYAMTGDELAAYKELQKNTERSISGCGTSAVDKAGETECSGGLYTYTMTEQESADTCDAVFAVYSYEDELFRCVVKQNDTVIDGNRITAEFDGNAAYLVNDNQWYPCTLNIDNGKKSILLAKDSGKNAYAADFEKYRVTVDGSGAVTGIKRADSDALAAKESCELNNGDRVYAVIDEYEENSYAVHSVPDIITLHDMSFIFDKAEGDYYGRFELINSYGYVQYRSAAIAIDCPGVKAGIASEKKTVVPENSISVNGRMFSVPCSFEKLKAAGFTLVNETERLASGECARLTMTDGSGYMDITVKNFSMSSADAEDCTVTGLSSAWCSGCGIETGDYITGEGAAAEYETAHTKKYLYKLGDSSVIPELKKGELAINGLYNSEPHDYVMVETDKATGRVMRISVNSEEGCRFSETAAVNAAPEYKPPKSLGYDVYSFILKLENNIYYLPVPVSALISDGWKIECDAEVIASGAEAGAVFEKNSRQFKAELVNYGADAADYMGCMVCGIYLDYTKESTAAAELPGGLKLNEAAESIMAGRYSDVYNKANRFMNYNGVMLYASGRVLDYDGEIEISADGAYLYRRYNGKRAMGGFDKPARYLVY